MDANGILTLAQGPSFRHALGLLTLLYDTIAAAIELPEEVFRVVSHSLFLLALVGILYVLQLILQAVIKLLLLLVIALEDIAQDCVRF